MAQTSWNSGSCCSFAKRDEIDDTTFIIEVMDILVRDHNVDPDQIYVTGHSNGAIHSYRIGCELGSRLRGVIPFAGSFGIKEDETWWNRAQVNPPKKTDPVTGIEYTMYDWDPAVNKATFKKLNDYYQCSASPKTDWLIINGSEDKGIPLKGGI